MEMVAAAKLRRFQDFLESNRPYMQGLTQLLGELLEEIPSDYKHPFLKPPSLSPEGRGSSRRFSPLPSGGRGQGEGQLKKTVLLVFTSDTGLCGTYNSELEAKAGQWITEQTNRKINLLFIGNHGAGALQRRGEVLARFSNLRVSRVDEILEELRKTLEKAFLEERIDEVEAVYTRMESLVRFQPTVERLLPLTPPTLSTGTGRGQGEGSKIGTGIIIEPNPKIVLDRFLPLFFEASLRFIFYHALLTEQIARMNAMRQATKNAKDMIDELTLVRNKARQASITKEIIEIVGGSRALKMK